MIRHRRRSHRRQRSPCRRLCACTCQCRLLSSQLPRLSVCRRWCDHRAARSRNGNGAGRASAVRPRPRPRLGVSECTEVSQPCCCPRLRAKKEQKQSLTQNSKMGAQQPLFTRLVVQPCLMIQARLMMQHREHNKSHCLPVSSFRFARLIIQPRLTMQPPS